MKENKKFTDSISDALRSYGHIYAFVIFAFAAFATRIRGYENLRTDSGAIALLGNDSWYHYRAIRYSVDNFPFTLNVDPKSGYPVGANSGTFGTLYDQILATVSLVIGLGNPSQELIRQIMMFSSPVFFVISLIVVYHLTKYISDSKWISVAAVGIVTFIPGTLYERTVAGFAQHHVLEVIFLLMAVLFTIKAIDKAEQENITWSMIQLRELDNLKPWLKSTSLAIFAIFLYYITWPPAMFFFGLLAIGAGVHALINYDSNVPTEPVLLTYMLLIASSVVFVLIQNPTMDTTVARPSIIHLGVAGLSLLGTTLLFAYNKYGQEHNWSKDKFRGISIGTGILAISVLFLAQPSVVMNIFDSVVRLLGFPFGLGGESVQTIAEEQSTTLIDLSYSQYGLLLLTAIAGIIMTLLGIIGSSINTKGYASNLFLSIVAVFFVVISIRTIRFNYYLAPIVAIFSMLAIRQIILYVDIPDNKSDVEGYQIIALALIITLIVPILFLPVSGTVFAGPDRVNIDSYQEWEEPLEWMSESTETDNIPNYVSTNSQPYEYDEDTYGVMSWWDYGHWITVTGDRAPVSNPFQQHAEESSQFLLADDSEQAESVITDMDENADIRYIAIDWQMASPFSKFTAMTEFNEDVSSEDLITPYYVSDGNTQRVEFFDRSQRYYESMVIRLYYGHGGQMDPGPYTVDYSISTEQNQEFRTIITQQNPVTVHNTTEEAREYADNNPEVAFGGFGVNPPEQVDALENYRLVKSSSYGSFQNPPVGVEINRILNSATDDIQLTEFDSNPSSVKIFEKVEGAEINGDGAEPNEIVTITVQMSDPNTGLTFEYKQDTQADSNGEFDATVPYSTTGYDDVDYPPNVQAQGDYIIEGSDSNKSQTVEISESDIISTSNPNSITLEDVDVEDDELGEGDINIGDDEIDEEDIEIVE